MLTQAIAKSVFGSADLLLHMNMTKRANEVIPCFEVVAKALEN
jgi:hypothetical protein